MDMSMSMSMTDSATSTMSSMSMATSSSSMDMSSSSSSDMMGMDSMAMTFFTSTVTPLFSMTWTPTSTGQYAGTCIFLIVFSAIFRGLLAVRVNIFQVVRVLKREDEEVRYGMGNKANVRPWRAGEAAWIASMDVLLGGVAYLLMIAVMTMNVGYFLSVLAGIWAGSFVFGRFMASSASH